MLFILNGKMEVVDTLSNDGDLSEITPFFDDEYKQYLSTGADTFTFSTMANTRESEHLVVGNYIAFMYKDKERLFHITEIEETHDEEFTKTVYCETAGIELINEIIRPMTMNSVSLTRFLSSVLSETEWEVGFVDTSLTDVHDININNYPSIYSTLQEHVVGTYGGEISFTCKLQGGRLAKKYVNVYARRGNVNGYRFEYSSNISSITKKSDSSNLVTALIGKGKDGLTFASIEAPDKPKNQDFIADEDAYKRWNLNGSHIMGVFECDTESKQELLKLTREELEKRKNPQVSYELKTEMLGDDIEIGDTVRVADHEFNPPIQLEARVSELTISFTDQSKNECVLSNFVEISSNITSQMKKIASQLEGYIDNKFPISGDKIQDGAVSGDKISQSYTDKVVSDSVNASKVVTNELIADKASISDLKAINATIKNLKAEKADITDLNAVNATINNLKANKADISDLNSTNATIGNLKADVAKINTVLAGNITADNIHAGAITADKIQTGAITAGSGIIADGAIGSAQISSLDASKISAGKIDTSKVEVAGANSHLRIKGNRLQVFQGTGSKAKERVSLGDVNGDGTIYGLRVRGADGKTVLMDENGVKSEGITDGSITNDKISDNAEIDGAKLNINSVINKINDDGTETINGTKIEVEGQTLNVKLSTITNKQNEDGEKITQAQSQITANTKAIGLKVDTQTYQTDKNNITTQMNKNTSAIDVMKDQIALKVEQTDINNAKSELEGSIDSKINSAKSEIKVTTDKISQNVSSLTNTVNKKADSTTVTTINNKVSSLETSVTGISQKVSSVESTTSSLNTKVNNAQSTADSAKTTATNAQSTANTANSTANANKGSISSLQTTVNNTSSKVSSLETNLSGITQRVSSTESSLTQTKKDLSNLEIGARNLLLATGTQKTVTGSNTTNQCTSIYNLTQDKSSLNNQKLTLSFTYKVANYTGGYFKVQAYSTVYNSWDSITPSGNGTFTFKGTITVASNFSSNIGLQIRMDGFNGNITISNMKLEKGDKATDWTPAPEDIDSSISIVDGKVDTANKNISSLTSRVSTAESKLTKDSLTTTIGSHYTTKNDVEGVVTSKGYQTQSQVQQTVNSLQAKFTSSGGYNLLRNGCAKNGTAYWSNNGGGISVGTAGSGNGLGEGATYFSSSFPSGITGEWVTLKPNTDYIYSAKLWSASSFTGSTTTPLHFWCSSTKVSGNTQLTVIDYKSECKANEWNDVYVHFRTKGGTVYFKPFVYLGGTTNINFSVSEIMLCEGVIKCPYSPHPSEVYDGITTIDKDGITVVASNVKSKTSMSANGFRITKTDTNEDVFKVGSDGKLIMTGDIQGSTFSSTSGDFKVLDDGTVDATSLSVEDEVSTDTLNVEYISNTKYQAVIDRNYEVHINPWYEWESEGLEHGGHYKSLSSFIDACPRNLNGYNITVNIWSDLTESVNFNMFNNGILTLQLNECTIYGYIVCNNHSMRYRIYGNNSSSTGSKLGSIMPNTGFSATGGYYSLMGSYTHLTVYDMKLYGGKASGNNNGLCITNLSKCYANNVQFVGCYSGIRSYSVSNTYVSSSSGLTTNVAFYAGSGSTIALNNTNQAGRSGSTNHTGTANNGQVLSSGATFSSSAVSGSNTTTSTPTVTKTATITANYGDTYRKTVYNNWKRDGSVRQGEWNNYGDCVGAWFFGEKISSYSDKNITGVSITIKRQAGGSSSAVTHTLKMHDHETRPSGSPTFRSDFSKDFSVATNKSTTINLSSSEIATFKKCKGLGLVPKAYNSTYYSVCSGSITVKITYKE